MRTFNKKIIILISLLSINNLILTSQRENQSPQEALDEANQALKDAVNIEDLRNIISKYCAQWQLYKIISYSGGVQSLMFSPMDNKQLACAYYDNRLIIYNVFSNEEIQKIIPDTYDNLLGLKYSNNPKYLAAISSRRGIKIYDITEIDKLKEIRQLRDCCNYSESSIAYSSDNRLFASAHRTIDIFNIDSGEKFREIISPASIYTIDFSPISFHSLASSNGNDIHIWDINTGNITVKLEGHKGSVESIAYSHDGKYLASGSYDKTVKVWDPNTGKILHDLSGHKQEIKIISYSPDGKFLASAADNIIIWDSNTGLKFQEIHLGDLDEPFLVFKIKVNSLSFSADSQFLAFVHRHKNKIFLYRLTNKIDITEPINCHW